MLRTFLSLEVLVSSTRPPQVYVDITKWPRQESGQRCGDLKKIRILLLNIRAQRMADAASGYHLIRCKIRLRLARNRKKQASRTIYNTAKLKDPLQKRSFNIALKNHFEALANDHPGVDGAWAEHRDNYYTTVTETLGQRARSWKVKPSIWNCNEEQQKLKQSILNYRSEQVRENKQQVYQTKDKKLKKTEHKQTRREPWKE